VEAAIPTWTALAVHAADHDVSVCLRMHPSMLVYEPASFWEANNDRIEANFDLSHLY
jgi:DNA-(apurinic or apyrimidinic site) lyase